MLNFDFLCLMWQGLVWVVGFIEIILQYFGMCWVNLVVLICWVVLMMFCLWLMISGCSIRVLVIWLIIERFGRVWLDIWEIVLLVISVFSFRCLVMWLVVCSIMCLRVMFIQLLLILVRILLIIFLNGMLMNSMCCEWLYFFYRQWVIFIIFSLWVCLLRLKNMKWLIILWCIIWQVVMVELKLLDISISICFSVFSGQLFRFGCW